MGIEEIKKNVKDAQANPAIDRGYYLAEALLWIIEKLQETPTVQVARLEPGDVVVVRVPFSLTMSMRDQIMADNAKLFPGHKVVVLEAGITLSAVQESCCSLPADIPHKHASFADVVEAHEAQRDE